MAQGIAERLAQRSRLTRKQLRCVLDDCDAAAHQFALDHRDAQATLGERAGTVLAR